MKLHEKIDSIRESKGITQKHVADVCGKPSQWYYDLKIGRSSVKAEDLGNIAKALGVDVTIFFENALSDARKIDNKQAI